MITAVNTNGRAPCSQGSSASPSRLLFYSVFFWLDPDRCRMGLQRAPSAAACAAATVDDPMCTDLDLCLVEPIPEVEIDGNHRAEMLYGCPS